MAENFAGDSFDILQEQDQARVRDAMKDLIMLAGVLKDLASERFWHEPRCAYDTLRTFDLILKSTFYEEEAVQGEQELYYRFEREYAGPPVIDIPRLVRLGRRYNLLTGPQQPPLKFTSTGKRLVAQFFRLANDALAYHRHALKDLYQAERDLQLARAYEDVGVGRHDTIASVLNNLEYALHDLRYQREKYIQDRRVLERYESVAALLDMLEKEVEERLARLEGIIDRKLERQYRKGSLLFFRLLQELSALLGENAYLAQLQIGRKIIRVDRERFLQYLVDVYAGNLPAGGLTPLQILKYMEDGVYEEAEEEVPGLWLPFTLAPCLHEEDIRRGVEQLNDWIENWAPPAAGDDFPVPACAPARRVTAGELAEILGATTSVAMELATDTRPVVEAVRANPGLSLDELLRLLGNGWPEAIRNLFVLGYLVNEGEVRLFTFPEDNERFRGGAGVSVDRPPEAEKSAEGPGKYSSDRLSSWRLGYPDDAVRYVKGTAALGRHLEQFKLG